MIRPASFDRVARLLHWTMALMILAMLFIGVAMVASVSQRPWLIALHRPLGAAILLLAIWRLIHRLRHRPHRRRRLLPPPALQEAAERVIGHCWLLWR